ncbi:hypothetical protein ACLIBH_12330 [Virgibacillus sp. W0430]|uniref:hypothetical protein n=1 Tax=Virgibacillus sp. W0430 TaxID=3391580 RepID=UPI003F481737
MKWFHKDIKVGHYFYIMIILSMIIIFLLAVDYWDLDNAGMILNNIATATSIVLAVLAIIITLVDVAGQKEGVSDLKEAVREVKDTLETAKQINIDNKNEMRKIADLREELLERFEEQKEMQEVIRNKIDQTSDEDVKRELKKIIDENSKINMVKFGLKYKDYNNIATTSCSSEKFNKVVEVLLSKMVSGKGYRLQELRGLILNNNINFSIKGFENLFDRLLRKRILDIEKENNEILYFLNDN